MSLVRSSLKVPPNLRLFQGSLKGTIVTKEKLPLKVANMDFDYVFIIDLLRTVVCKTFWTTNYFLGYCVYLHVLDKFEIFLIFKFQIVEIKGSHKGSHLLSYYLIKYPSLLLLLLLLLPLNKRLVKF